jgi:RHS repeat-associated protein
VGYTHAGGVDRPLVAYKTAGGNAGAVVVPHMNWRGLFSLGTNPDGGTSTTPVEWPGFRTTANHSMCETQAVTKNWMGSLLEGQRDAGGQMYMRNRYYDPATGQFTQTDPIGIAGGLNTYGFAAGDPVSYKDSYGLSAQCETPPCRSDDDPMKDRPLPPGIDEGDVTWDPEHGWYVHDEDGRIIRPHPEDAGHWDHWEIYPPGMRGRPADFPSNKRKPWPNQKRGPYGPQSPTDPWNEVPGARMYRWRVRAREGLDFARDRLRRGDEALRSGLDRMLEGFEAIDPVFLLPPLPGLTPLPIP